MTSRDFVRQFAAVAVGVVVAVALWVGTEFVVGVVGFCVYGKDEVPPLVVAIAGVTPWLVALTGGIIVGRSVAVPRRV